jgi:hypothetical protein
MRAASPSLQQQAEEEPEPLHLLLSKQSVDDSRPRTRFPDSDSFSSDTIAPTKPPLSSSVRRRRKRPQIVSEAPEEDPSWHRLGLFSPAESGTVDSNDGDSMDVDVADAVLGPPESVGLDELDLVWGHEEACSNPVTAPSSPHTKAQKPEFATSAGGLYTPLSSPIAIERLPIPTTVSVTASAIPNVTPMKSPRKGKAMSKNGQTGNSGGSGQDDCLVYTTEPLVPPITGE